MGIVTTDAGALKIMDTYFNSNNLTLKLFTNDYTPAEGSTASDFTEAAGGGYVSRQLAAGGWTAGLDPDGIATVIYDIQLFSFTGALTSNATIYGVYVVDSNDICIFYERGAATFTPVAEGEVYAVIPKFQASSGTPT